MEKPQRTSKVNCIRCGKRQGTCFVFCVMCGAKLPQRNQGVKLGSEIESNHD